MGISLNLGDVELRDFEPIPSGDYHVKITDGAIQEAGPNAKNPGSQYINWELTVQDGEFQNRKVFWNTSLLPQALFGIKQLIKATADQTGLDPESNVDFDIEDLIGKECTAVVQKTTYNDQPVNNVRRVKALSEEASEASSSLMP